MNTIRRYLVVSRAPVAENILRILNTIKPVARPFTAMVTAKLVVLSGDKAANEVGASQVARGYKLESDYKMKID